MDEWFCNQHKVQRSPNLVNFVGAATSAASASMLDTGNFVLYDSDNQTIWESFKNPTDTILPTQQLSADGQ
jgi:hypothetical protein